MNWRTHFLVLVSALLALAGAVSAQESAGTTGDGVYIAGIRFEGNKRTQPHIMLQEANLRVGDTVKPERIEAARQAIMDLGLFKSVAVNPEPAAQGVVLVFAVEEKFFLLPVPLLNGDPNNGDYSYGLELRVDNLGGLNQRIRLKYEQEHSGSNEVPFNREGSINYNYPRVLGTAYNLGLSYSLKQEDFNDLDERDEVRGEYHRNISRVGAGVSRWFNQTGPSRGWFGGVGMVYQQHEYNFLSGTPDADLQTSEAVSLTANAGTNNVHDHGFYNTGATFGWNGELGVSAFGSDYNFTRHLFYYRVYNHLENAANLNWQLRIGFADGEPFGGKAYSIGGFSTLRGYQDAIRGNGLALSNLEYHQQIDNLPTVRGVWFLDLGNAYDTVADMEPGDLEAGTGVGVRWRIQSLVDVTLSADLAYGLGTQEPVFYLMTTGTF